MSRDLRARGHNVTGVDAVPAMLDAARAADPVGRYVLADAAALPFADGAFDLVVAYNALMDIRDLEGSVREAARVVEPGAPFCVCVTHPLADVGRFAGEGEDAPFVIEGSYLERGWFEGTFERGGLRLELTGWTQPLEAYMAAFEAAGLAVEALREPARPGGDGRWRRNTSFLMLRARGR